MSLAVPAMSAARTAKQQQQQQQQRKHHDDDDELQPCCCLDGLPESCLVLIASALAGGSLENFRVASQRCRSAASFRAATLDVAELAGWQDDDTTQPAVATALRQRPNITGLLVPSGWRRASIEHLLRHASGGVPSALVGCSSSSSSSSLTSSLASSSTSSITTARSSSLTDFSSTSLTTSSTLTTKRQLSRLALHFKSLSPSLCGAIAAHAPQLTRLELGLDLAFELTSRQAWRISALSQLSALRSLSLEPELGPEALACLTSLTDLQELQLSGGSTHPTCAQPGGSLRTLCSMQQLTSLRFKWTAGRTMPDASPLAALTNLRKLHCWLGASQELPPCSNRPLRGLLSTIGQLGLTELRFLRGLHLSWDLRKLRHLAGLSQLQVLSLHDCVVSEEELALLSPCTALQELSTDTLRLAAVHSQAAQAAAAAAAAATAAAAAGAAEALVPSAAAAFSIAASQALVPTAAAAGAAAAAAGAAAGVAAGVAAAAAEPRDRITAALLVLSRLVRLSVNVLHIGSHHMADLCPLLTHLGPLADTLSLGGTQGCVWNLGALRGHPRLESLGLMVGSLGTSCSCSTSFRAADASVSSLAAAVMRVLLHSTGLNAIGSTPRGITLQQLLQLLASLPALQHLQLWGHAGGLSGKLLESTKAHVLAMAALGGGGGSSSNSSRNNNTSCGAGARRKRRSVCGGSSWDGRRSSGGGGAVVGGGGGPAASRRESAPGGSSQRLARASSVGAVVGSLLCSFGSLLTPLDMEEEAARLRDGGRLLALDSKQQAAVGPRTSFSGAASDGLLQAPDSDAQHQASSSSSAPGAETRRARRSSGGGGDGSRQPARTISSLAAAAVCAGEDRATLVLPPPPASACALSSSCDDVDAAFVAQLLRSLPSLHALTLRRCSHLEEGGAQLARECCGRYSPAAVLLHREDDGSC